MSNYKYCFKICILGNSRVGKSTYINRLIENPISTFEIEPTIGVDFNCHVIEKNNYKYKFQFYDTSGLPSFYKIITNYYDITNIFIIFIETKNSKETDLSYWYNEIKNHKNEKDKINKLKVIVIANKIDLFDNDFTQEKFMKSYKSKFKSLNAELFLISTKCSHISDLLKPLNYIIEYYSNLINAGLCDYDSIKIYQNEEGLKTPLLCPTDNNNVNEDENDKRCCKCSIL